MRQKNLTDVCIVSEDPYFINRIKIFGKNSNITFDYSFNSYCNSTPNLYLIDIDQLEVFLNEKPGLDAVKFIIHGNQKDIAASFNSGCIDFLKDPWDNDELEARISNALCIKNKFILWDNLRLSQSTLLITNYSINISIEEYIILKKLIENRYEPVPREALLFALWGREKEGSRAVDMHISNLRKKIVILKKQEQKCCSTIKTVRSYGYMID